MERTDVARQRDEYGGINWGAAFFGWLVAVGLGALLTALVSAAGAAIAFSEFDSVDEAVNNSSGTIGIVGAICLLVVAGIAYFSGGYVAGRMSRFDGSRQGGAVWIWSIVAIVILAVLGAIAGSEYNLLGQIDLPRIPIDEGDVTVGGVIALVALAAVTLIAAIGGGRAGERYHRRVDAAGYVDRGDRVERRDDLDRDDRVERGREHVDRDRDGVDDREEGRRRPLRERLTPSRR